VVISFRKRTFPQHFLGRLLYRERNADTGLGHTWEPLNLVVGTESQAEEANGRKRQQAVPYSTKVNSFFINFCLIPQDDRSISSNPLEMIFPLNMKHKDFLWTQSLGEHLHEMHEVRVWAVGGGWPQWPLPWKGASVSHQPNKAVVPSSQVLARTNEHLG
jgi:hypothetical protein